MKICALASMCVFAHAIYVLEQRSKAHAPLGYTNITCSIWTSKEYGFCYKVANSLNGHDVVLDTVDLFWKMP